MKIKVYTENVKVGIEDDFAKAMQYFKEMANVNFEFEFEKIKVKNKTLFRNSNVGAYSIEGFNTEIPSKDEYMAIYAFNAEDYNETTTSKMIGFSKPYTSLMSLKTNPSDDSIGWIWKSIVHEIMHGLFQKAYFAGFRGMIDQMDKTLVNGMWVDYYKNHDPYAPDGNHAVSLKILEPYLATLRKQEIEIPIVTLTRKYANSKQQLGDLVAKNVLFKTLELSWKDNKPNISCISTGEYLCNWTFSPKFMKYTYQIMDVPYRSGIRFHPASWFSSLQGCIALGTHYTDLNKDDSADLANSKKSIKKFEDLMERKPFKLIIK